MKLKSLLLIAFFTLTLLPIILVTLLLYKSGLDLSKESYMRNLRESITVQEDYIAQNVEGNMISDYRFAYGNREFFFTESNSAERRKGLITAFQSYLDVSEDKITVCMVVDKENKPIYSLGEAATVANVTSQLPDLSLMTGQEIKEFELEPGSYSLGMITPVQDENGAYAGSFISIYSKFYIFKIISSYYKVSDTSIYICRENGSIINFRKFSDDEQNSAIEKALEAMSFTSEGRIDMSVGDVPVSGYYMNIHNTPWFLVGFTDDNQIYTFVNKFIWVYIFIILLVLVADIILSLYFSKKVVQPINSLIEVMESYQGQLNKPLLQKAEADSYFEIQYLRKKFADFMYTITRVTHNFEGIYQLYQSNDMNDTNIDIDAKNQTVVSNKKVFQDLMNNLEVPSEACVVERFALCFCDKDAKSLMRMFENMRDEHLAVASEAEIYTPHLGRKWFHSLVVPMYEDDRLSRLFIQLRDISAFKKQEYESIEKARRDQLTGVYNRTGFMELASRILLCDEDMAQHGLLFIDMDYFKLVNDNFGHSEGDTLLCSVGKHLLSAIGPHDIVSRFGGDEFAVFLPNITAQGIEEVKDNIARRLVYPYRNEKVSFVVSASIGVATWNSTFPCTLEELLQQADQDMYNAKRTLKSIAAGQSSWRAN